MHKLFENAAAMLIVLKLVEAGARGGQQNNVSSARSVSGGVDGALESSGLLDGDAARNLLFDFVRRSAD